MIRKIIANLILYKNISPYKNKQFYLTNDKKLVIYAYNVNIYDFKHIYLLNIIRYIIFFFHNNTPYIKI